MDSTLNNSPNPAVSPRCDDRPLSKEDHLRIQFESLQRQPELAADMSCFRPGEALSSIRYIANAHNVHVARWLKVLSYTQATIEIDTANPVPKFSNGFISANPILPRWLRLPMVLRYALSGLALRFWRSPSTSAVIHAHGASGNGLVAWLSGQRYLIGIYGSEIYAADERGKIYRWLMRQILQGADRICISSTEGIKILTQLFQVPAERIYFFHLGYDDSHFRPLNHAARMQLRQDRQLPVDEPIWVVNRRTHPHYRTREVAEGFLQYCQRGGKGRLVLLCGDQQADYTKSICDLIQAHRAGDRIVVVDRMLAAEDLASWLQLGDFSISVPLTDNFSVSILESMGCGTAPILADLEAYRWLQPFGAVRWMSKFEATDFATMFSDTAATWSILSEARRIECSQFAQDHFSTEGVIRDTAAFYLGLPLPKEAAVKTKRAA